MGECRGRQGNGRRRAGYREMGARERERETQGTGEEREREREK